VGTKQKSRWDIKSTEVRLRQRLAKVIRENELLRVDVSGSEIIAELKGEISTLKEKADRTGVLQIKCTNLSAKNKQLALNNQEQKREISRLKADLAYAYELERKAKAAYLRCEKNRFRWAEKARGLALRLSATLAENRSLKARLNRSPQNSSIPPSVCPTVKKTIYNSRVSSDRKPGGQPGHIGHCRKWRAPDITTILHPPVVCPSCGGALVASGRVKTRQMTDLVISVLTTEYISEEHSCAACGKQVRAQFPQGVTNEVNYGNNIRAVSTYLVNGCNVSIDNTTGFLFEATGHELSVSKGSIHNFLAEFSKAALADIADIADIIKAAHVVGTDATHTRSAGKQAYIYNFNSSNAALYQSSENKGTAPLKDSPIAGYQGVLVHDHDPSYYHFGAANAECNVHVLRYLKGVCQNEPEKTWAKSMSALLHEANKAAKLARAKGCIKLDDKTITEIERHFDEIINTAEREYAADLPIPHKYRPEGIALSARLKKYRDNHLAFLYDLSIPFDNNASERLLRCAKKKLKQSGGFRSTVNGQALYCDFLTVMQTATLRNMERLSVVRDIFNGYHGMFRTDSQSSGARAP